MSGSSPAMPDFRGLSKLDNAILAGGVLTFIVSFFPWYGLSVPRESFGNITVGGGSYTVSAWHSYSTLALLLALASLAVMAMVLFAPDALSSVPVGGRFIAAGLAVLGAFLELIRLLTLHHGDGLSIRWGEWLLLIVMIATAIATAMAAMQSGEAPPWQQGGATPPPAA